MSNMAFSKNLIELQNSPYLNLRNEGEKNGMQMQMFPKIQSPSPNSFCGSYILINQQMMGDKHTNPFYQEYNKLKSEKRESKENILYFGAFSNTSISPQIFKCGIPSLEFKQNKSDPSIQSELQSYLLQYPADLPTQAELPKTEVKHSTNFVGVYLNDQMLNSSIYTSANIIKTIPQVLLERSSEATTDTFYESNLLEETILLNPFKVINYEISLQKTFKNLIYDIKQPCDLQAFYTDLIYLLQGIPSKTFSLNTRKFPFIFELTDARFRFLTCIHQVSSNFISYFIEFGSKMSLIQLVIKRFLFSYDSSEGYVLPFVMRRFYEMVNEILIQINEKLIGYKTRLECKELSITGLYNKVTSLYSVVNIIYSIFNFSKMDESNGLEEFLRQYKVENLHQKSHRLINSLFCFYHSFYVKSKTYMFIKSLLVTSLHSYLYFITFLIFSNEIIDCVNEYFIIQSSDRQNIALDHAKVPFFLQDYKNVLLNNSILLNLIKKYEENFFHVCCYKLEEFIHYLDSMNLIHNFTSSEIKSFIEFKDKIFNKKLEMMFTVNENILNNLDIKRNELKLHRVNQIKNLKEFITQNEERSRQNESIVREKKRRYLLDLQSQMLEKRNMIEKDIRKIKDARVEKMELEKENEDLKKEIVSRLKRKYEIVKDQTKEMETLGTVDSKGIWKIRRHNNRTSRNELFHRMFDEDLIEGVYSSVTSSRNQNFHFNQKQTEDVNNEDRSIALNEVNVNINININLPNEPDPQKIITTEFDEMSISSIHTIKTNTGMILKSKQTANAALALPKFFIKNIIFNEILNPILETAMEIASAKLEKKMMIKEKYKTFPKFVSKNNQQVDSELIELVNKIQVLITEKETEASCKRKEIIIQDKIIFPIQVILQEFFYDMIIKQYKITNNCIVLMLRNKFCMNINLEFFHQIFLCRSGDVIGNFIKAAIDFSTLSLISNEEEFLNSILRSEINRKFSNVNSDYIEFGKFISFSKSSKLSLNFSICNIDMAFKVEYKCNAPLNFVFTSHIIDKYDSIFKFLLKFVIYQTLISRTYAVIKNMKKKKLSKEDAVLFGKTTKIFFCSLNTLKAVESYIFNEIIYCEWQKLMAIIESSADIFEINELHYQFLRKLDNIFNQSFFMKLMTKFQKKFMKLYLKSVIIDYFDFQSLKSNEEFKKLLQKIDNTNAKVRKYIKDEHVIGEFTNLNNYLIDEL